MKQGVEERLLEAGERTERSLFLLSGFHLHKMGSHLRPGTQLCAHTLAASVLDVEAFKRLILCYILKGLVNYFCACACGCRSKCLSYLCRASWRSEGIKAPRTGANARG